MVKPFAAGKRLTVAVLGTGRLGETHIAALARLRDGGMAIEPALYGRNAGKVDDVAHRYGVRRTSTELNELIDASDVDVVDNCLVNALHYGPLMRATDNG